MAPLVHEPVFVTHCHPVYVVHAGQSVHPGGFVAPFVHGLSTH